MAERMFKMNTKTNKKATNNKQNNNVKGKKMKNISVEQEAKRNELIKMSERIKTQYHEISKLENSINANTYEIGKTLADICENKLFKLMNDVNQKAYSFNAYCEHELPFSSKYAYMLIKAAHLQDVLEKEQLTEVKQGHHQLRKLSKFVDDLELLRKIWQKASDNDPQRVLNMADVVTALEEITSDTEKSTSDDPVETAFNNVMKWGGFKKLTKEQRSQLIDRLNKFINSDVENKDDKDNNN